VTFNLENFGLFDSMSPYSNTVKFVFFIVRNIEWLSNVNWIFYKKTNVLRNVRVWSSVISINCNCNCKVLTETTLVWRNDSIYKLIIVDLFDFMPSIHYWAVIVLDNEPTQERRVKVHVITCEDEERQNPIRLTYSAELYHTLQYTVTEYYTVINDDVTLHPQLTRRHSAAPSSVDVREYSLNLIV
jgi:hypothetical protein